MRLIDAEVFEELFYKQIELGANGFEAAEDALHDTPTADAVQVVRCKDCLYATPTFGNNYIRCAIWGEGIKNDKYCFCGKRRRVKRNEL